MIIRLTVSEVMSIAKSYGIKPRAPCTYIDLFWAFNRGKTMTNPDKIRDMISYMGSEKEKLKANLELDRILRLTGQISLPLDKNSGNIVIDFTDILACKRA